MPEKKIESQQPRHCNRSSMLGSRHFQGQTEKHGRQREEMEEDKRENKKKTGRNTTQTKNSVEHIQN
jgi:hypothetical protein